MSGLLKLFVLFATLIGGWLALDYVWTGSLDPHASEIAESFAVITVMAFIVHGIGRSRKRS